MSAIPRFDLDLTGTNPNNFVVNEVHTLTTQTVRAVSPIYGPYYTESLSLYDHVTSRKLETPADYTNVEICTEASIRSGQEVCSVILITNTAVSDSVRVSYQSVGGWYVQSIPAIGQAYEAYLTDNRPVLWENVVGRPPYYPPNVHPHLLMDIKGFEPIIAAIERVRDAIVLSNIPAYQALIDYVNQRLMNIDDQYGEFLNPYLESLSEHVADFENPHHVTAEQVGAISAAAVDALLENYLLKSGGVMSGDLTLTTAKHLYFKGTTAGTSVVPGGMVWQDSLGTEVARMVYADTSIKVQFGDGTETYTVWHSGNDGAASTLDAGLFAGQVPSYYLDYSNLDNVPTSFAPSAHSHAQSDVSGLTSALNDISIALANVDAVELGGQLPSYYLDYSNLDNVPTSFAPSAHSHAQSDVSGLTGALSGKQPLLGFTPVQQGTGVGQGTNAIKIGWNAAAGQTKLTVDATDMGAIAMINHTTSQSLEDRQGTMKIASAASLTVAQEDLVDTDAITPKKLRWGLSYSFGLTSGYIRLPVWLLGGLTFQYGLSEPAAEEDGVQTIMFPTPYTTRCLVVVPGTVSITTADHYDVFAMIVNTTSTWLLDRFYWRPNSTTGDDTDNDIRMSWWSLGI